jgi:ribonuclease VapC
VIVDSSALVAIAASEPEKELFVEKIDAAEFAGVGAPTLVETGIVLAGRGMLLVDDLLEAAPVTVVDFGEAHWREALAAWSRFGRSRHPANLNFGDCLAYATAKVASMPLLAKGGDFALTDIELA